MRRRMRPPEGFRQGPLSIPGVEVNRIYQTTQQRHRMRPEVLEAIAPLSQEQYGNPSSIYTEGRGAPKGADRARDRIAKVLGASSPREIIFTSGGSDWRIIWPSKEAAFALKNKGNHIMASAIEHHAVYDTCRYLEKHGFKVTLVPSGLAYGTLIPPHRGSLNPGDYSWSASCMPIMKSVPSNPLLQDQQNSQERGSCSAPMPQTVGHIPVDVMNWG